MSFPVPTLKTARYASVSRWTAITSLQPSDGYIHVFSGNVTGSVWETWFGNGHSRRLICSAPRRLRRHQREQHANPGRVHPRLQHHGWWLRLGGMVRKRQHSRNRLTRRPVGIIAAQPAPLPRARPRTLACRSNGRSADGELELRPLPVADVPTVPTADTSNPVPLGLRSPMANDYVFTLRSAAAIGHRSISSERSVRRLSDPPPAGRRHGHRTEIARPSQSADSARRGNSVTRCQ